MPLRYDGTVEDDDMEAIEVEAVEDRSRAEGGHALILLRGIEGLPPTGKFRLALADAEASTPEARSLRENVFTPLAVARTGEGLALSVGPEVTEQSALVPGTACTLEVVELGVSGVLLWPAITPTARPKRRNIMTRRMAGDPLPARVGPARSFNQPAAPAGMRSTASRTGPDTSEVTTSQAEPEHREQLIERSSPRRVVARVAPAQSRVQMPPHPAPTSPPPHSTASNADCASGEEKAATHNRSAVVGSVVSTIHLTDEPPAINSNSTPHATIDTKVCGLSPSPQDLHTTPSTTARMTEAPNPALPSHEPRTDETPPGGGVSSEQQRSADTANARRIRAASRTIGTPVHAVSTLGAAAITASLLIAAQFAAMTALDLNISPRQKAFVSLAPAAPVPSNEPAEAIAAMPAPPARNIYDVIVAGPRSPRGVSGDGVPAAKAIQTAHAMLHGPVAQRDPQEAIYWLKRYLSTASGAENARVALTQLGSAYVEPGPGDRDYTSARLAWELASALGDPVSMCFLGAMHEHGLGVEASPANASVWYERAAAAGRSCVTTSAEPPAR